MPGTFLSFSSPWVLLALALLPVLWWLLRITPPQPKHIDFPPLKILLDLVPKSEVPATTPWPLLLLRMLIMSLLILATAGPVWTEASSVQNKNPLMILVDNGATSAKTWETILTSARVHLQEAEKNGRLVAVVPLADPTHPFELIPASQALEYIRSLNPRSYVMDRNQSLGVISQFLQQAPEGTLLWLSDGLVSKQDQDFAAKLATTLSGKHIHIEVPSAPPALGIKDISGKSGSLAVTVSRGTGQEQVSGSVLALNNRGTILAESAFTFNNTQKTTSQDVVTTFELPLELRNAIHQFQIKNENSALATFLTDSRSYLSRVGIVTLSSVNTLQPLLKPSYYIEKALSPFALVRTTSGSSLDQINEFLGARQETGNGTNPVSTLILTDTGVLDEQTQARLDSFVKEGGLLIRFAHMQLSSSNDSLLPVKIREGGRLLGGVMSWDAPKTLAPFPEKSPFFDITPPKEVTVTRQILAEPDGLLIDKTWAALEDGTPLVTANRHGRGLIVLFHVSADNRWSNLPLSGLFSDMLHRIVMLASTQTDLRSSTSEENIRLSRHETASLAPRLILDGFGQLTSPPPGIMALPSNFTGQAQPQHPAGFYGTLSDSVAVNVLSASEVLSSLDFSSLNASIVHTFRSTSHDLRVFALLGALVLFALDTFFSLVLSGFSLNFKHMPKFGKKRFFLSNLFFACLISFAVFPIIDSYAQTPAATTPASSLPPIKAGSFDAALKFRLGYVLTGNKQLDTISRAGLRGVSRILFQRTALEPADPLGVDIEQDELVFYPVLYWPIHPSAPLPSSAALKKVDAFMQNGGTIIFDTRDALRSNSNSETEETLYLRRLFKHLNIPTIEPVPPEHVLSKTYYLLDTFPGRYTTGKTWIEALPPKDETIDISPARGGDAVSPIIITTNDLAAAWAIDQDGRPLYPVSDDIPMQREYAYRFGVNLVMYVLTGNYKTDQVHVPALLERLKH